MKRTMADCSIYYHDTVQKIRAAKTDKEIELIVMKAVIEADMYWPALVEYALEIKNNS